MNNTKKEKSSIELWAEEEIRIACERQRHHNDTLGMSGIAMWYAMRVR